ncbi:hypothetical protein KFE25_009814 [Diacronema lutheri]|uniref:Mitochondrial splicing suppressor 51-like C-terminal domain-containing protein n=1 Tax=Diacronema lutheri TaxID=2081491 RepID=A0A8J6C4D5_DIALT|nr:hypothetical protein KFE25_009814 [Diacronema lutheri]
MAVPRVWRDVVPAASDAERAELSDALGRAHTMLLALDRLHGARTLARAAQPLALLVLGPDAREGSSASELARTFEPLVRGLLASAAPASGERELRVWLVLVGPNLLCAEPPFERAIAPVDGGGGLCATLRVSCVRQMLHESECTSALALPGGARFACAFAFNAGFWGYETWAASIRRLGELGDVPLVVTSYNELEADEDAGALEELGLDEARDWRWAPECNPFASTREWSNSLGRTARDNGWWQCVDARPSAARICAPELAAR